ncbi:hypothetical protein DRW41_18100 [Neobacillus piezotolerans]|uniref:YqgU-like 6-bladed beta-propeller domain-containing protein n=1 Tax=Neobacillus piezotolerans TaxID=2259171 RepID=A0A3D8GM08_9BACI|nr:hypothetical protein [Neobacillus piezotolerans]RDU35372.1 hypothetical protein DRW41_18100 [Neobacillus piezotolerans]
MGKSLRNKSDQYSVPARLLFICLVFFSLAACSQLKENTKPIAHPGNPEENEGQSAKPPENWKLPLKVPEGEFFKVFGWLNDSEVIFASNLTLGSNLYFYSLETGESKLILKTENPIVTVSINPQKTRLMVHTSPSSYEAVVTVYDTSGLELANQSYPSSELHVEWNPYEEDDLLIVAFNEDWSYKSFRMDAEERKVEEMDISDPFVKWIGRDKFAYLGWNEEAPSFFAPLVLQDVQGDVKTAPIRNLYHLEAYKNLIMGISAAGTEFERAIFAFYDNQLSPIFSFELPQLGRFSGWLVPFMDFNAGRQEFTIFEPVKSGDADTYTEGFILASHTFGGGRKVILEGAENQPIVSSPNGEAFLYGYRFEKMIDAAEKKILSLIQE